MSHESIGEMEEVTHVDEVERSVAEVDMQDTVDPVRTVEEAEEETALKQVDIEPERHIDTIEETEDQTGGGVPIPRQRPSLTPKPIPTPRRSERSRKKPEWFDSYYMNQMVHIPRPYDIKLEAIDKLMSSGILDNFDAT